MFAIHEIHSIRKRCNVQHLYTVRMKYQLYKIEFPYHILRGSRNDNKSYKTQTTILCHLMNILLEQPNILNHLLSTVINQQFFFQSMQLKCTCIQLIHCSEGSCREVQVHWLRKPLCESFLDFPQKVIHRSLYKL